QVGSFLNLGMKSQKQDMDRMTLGPPDFDSQFSTNPDFKQIHQRVDELLTDDGTPVSGAYLLQPTLGLYMVGSTSEPEEAWEPAPTQPDSSPTTNENLTQAEDTDQEDLLSDAAETNYPCQPD